MQHPQQMSGLSLESGRSLALGTKEKHRNLVEFTHFRCAVFSFLEITHLKLYPAQGQRD